jgi:predicted RND superfamily exporter protein
MTISDFQPTQNFGLLSAASIFTALVFDLIVLPSIIIMLSKIRKPKTA